MACCWYFSPTCAGSSIAAMCTTKTYNNDKAGDKNESSLLDLRGRSTATERGATFWNTSIIEMKFSIERSWIKSVRSAKNKPNYGMTNMDSLLEEVIGNKLEMCDPLIDSYLKEIGKAIGSKLSRSKATSLANPVILFVPWPVFCHVPTLARGYSGDTTALGPSPLDFHAEKEL